MSNNITRIHAVAVKTRQWCEHNSSGLFSNDLEGMCAIAAAKLFIDLTNAGFKCKIGYSDNNCFCHCFVICNNYYIVDVTATQFDKDNVVILPRKITQQHWFWKITKKFDSVKALYDYQHKEGWPPHQIVFPKLVKKPLKTVSYMR